MLNNSKAIILTLKMIVGVVLLSLIVSFGLKKPNCAQAQEQAMDEIVSGVISKIMSEDKDKIQSISEEEVNLTRDYLGDEAADSIQSSINVPDDETSGEDELDISKLPYSDENGVLEFSKISWANLGPIVGRIHLGWLFPDDSDGPKDIVVTDYALMYGTREIDLTKFGLPKGAKFHFYTDAKLGYSSDWSRWFRYNGASNFAIGCYTDKPAFSKGYVPAEMVYGDHMITNKTVENIAKNTRFKTLHNAITNMVMSAVGTLGHLAIRTAKKAIYIIVAAIGTSVAQTLVLASDIVLTVHLEQIVVEDYDLEKQSKDKNWIPDTGDSAEEFDEHGKPDEPGKLDKSNELDELDEPSLVEDEEPGHFAIRGFQYVSGGYFWSRPMVHWKRQSEDDTVDHKAYVNETVTNSSNHEVNKDGLRMGKAAGVNLADLSKESITDMNDPAIRLEEGDTIWFGAEVVLGNDRVADERFIYSKLSDYQAGYYSQGTTLWEKGYGFHPKAHLIMLGAVDKVGLFMAKFVKIAKTTFNAMIWKVALGTTIIIVTAALNGSYAFKKIKFMKSGDSPLRQDRRRSGQSQRQSQSKSSGSQGSIGGINRGDGVALIDRNKVGQGGGQGQGQELSVTSTETDLMVYSAEGGDGGNAKTHSGASSGSFSQSQFQLPTSSSSSQPSQSISQKPPSGLATVFTDVDAPLQISQPSTPTNPPVVVGGDTPSESH